MKSISLVKTIVILLMILIYQQCDFAYTVASTQNTSNIDDDWQSGIVIIDLSESSIKNENQISDPFESLNRKIFAFNKAFDYKILKPTAIAYRKFVPVFARSAITSFMKNLNEPLYFIHGVLTMNKDQIGRSIGRFGINSVFGVFGLFDVAAKQGLEQSQAKADATLRQYGVHTGPYIMLPFFGPSSARDSFGRVADLYIDPLAISFNYTNRFIIVKVIIDGIIKREYLLSYDDAIREMAIDEYAFLRSLYLQQNGN